MRIVLDARMYQESGIGRYIRNLISYLKILDRNNEYFILHLENDFQRLKYGKNFNKILADFRWYGIEEQIKLPGLLKSIKPDLVHFPHFNVPVFYGGKFVVTIHDLIHQHFSMKRSTMHGSLIYTLKQWGYKKVFQKALQESEKILVPSNFVKEQLNKNYQVNGEKIVVTYEAVDEEFKRSDLARSDLAKKFDYPYIFYIGNAHPHKNIEGLIKAFLKLKKKYENLKLILAGADHYFWQRIKKEFQFADIIYTGKVTDSKLAALYKNAKAFIMPSYEEGFGIPILESMSCSCPVVSSNAGSLPEIGKDAAIYFDPASPDDMAEKIGMVLSDEKLKQELIKKGLQRYRQFSWEKMSEKTLEVYRQCALQ